MALSMLGPLLGGLILLVLGAELLVRGASRLASALGISPLVVGLTVVAFGTSAPEFFVSLTAALRGQAAVAVGNAVGSNIFNLLFILGLSALITPLAVARKLVRIEIPILVGVTILLQLFGLDGRLGRWEAGALFALLIVYLVALGRGEAAAPGARSRSRPAAGATALQLLLVLGGLVLLLLGSRLLVDGASTLAHRLGASELVIGLTIVAAGTSLPEAATSILAALRHQRDIAVGNVLGSNIFNILGVLGAAGMAAPAGLALPRAAMHFDLPVSLAAALACLPIFLSGGRISRGEGLLLFGGYWAYLGWLLLNLPGRPVPAAPPAAFVLPVFGLALLVLASALLRRRSSRRRSPS